MFFLFNSFLSIEQFIIPHPFLVVANSWAKSKDSLINFDANFFDISNVFFEFKSIFNILSLFVLIVLSILFTLMVLIL